MSNTLNLRLSVLIAVLLWVAYMVVPNFLPADKKAWYLSDNRLKYGLDISGGLHLLMGVDVDTVLKESTSREADNLKKRFADEKINVTSVEAGGDKGMSVTMNAVSPADVQPLKAFMDKSYINFQLSEETGTRLVYSQTAAHVTTTRENAVNQAIEALRNRIDAFGVAEPSITKQGTDRILIQLPLKEGGADANRAKELIGRTAHLQFHIVSQDPASQKLPELIDAAEKAGNYSLGKPDATTGKDLTYNQYIERLNNDLKGKIPAGTIVRFERDERVKDIRDGKRPFLLETTTTLSGDMLTDAGVTFGQFNEPEVALRFNADGAKIFGDVTTKNIGRLLAIVLDDIVYSAPVLKSAITGGNAVIQLGRGDREKQLDEAKTISMALRSGALPAKLEQLEERTVGPTLGADAIQKGVRASWIAYVLIFAFMVYWYRGMGLIANMALALNVGLMLAVLSALDATLTLPGISGLALTMGMAVDANVIINERIKDELKKGATPAAAIKEGYNKAMSAIWDGNLTTIMVCVILYYFGTGPVRGFGVTLAIGLFVSMFTAIYATRIIADVLMYRFGVEYIPIGFDRHLKGVSNVKATV